MAGSPADEERARHEMRSLVLVHELLASCLARLPAHDLIAPFRDEEKALRCRRVAQLVDNRIRLAGEVLARPGAESALIDLRSRGDRARSR
jgi:hypothetical protein